MAYFSVAPTLCEVTYDSNRDEKVTPYRYQCRSANSRATNGITSPSFTEIVNVSLPSGYNVSYYEYLRTLYDSRISSPTKASVGMIMMIGLVRSLVRVRGLFEVNWRSSIFKSPFLGKVIKIILEALLVTARLTKLSKINAKVISCYTNSIQSKVPTCTNSLKSFSKGLTPGGGVGVGVVNQCSMELLRFMFSAIHLSLIHGLIFSLEILYVNNFMKKE